MDVAHIPLGRPLNSKPSSLLARSEYLIDRYLVVFEANKGHCVCAEFRASHECRHSRESEGRRAAQELIANRVRSIGGTLVGFTHRIQRADALASKRNARRSFSLSRAR